MSFRNWSTIPDTGWFGRCRGRRLRRGDLGLPGPARSPGRLPESRISVFNSFTHEKERSIAYLKLALAEMLPADNLIVSGHVSHLIPKKISHALRVCLIADLKFRSTAAARRAGHVEAKEAVKLIRKQDEDAALWVARRIGGQRSLGRLRCTILSSRMDKMTVDEADGI
ncbi:MAG: cytidylate kinase family protein [Chromatiales bacterium]|nr:cytidylate kinase family protein [Chromatiales bacterium]